MTENNYVKELLSTGIGTQGTLLLPRKIYDVLIDEVDKALIDRRYAAVYVGPSGIPGSSIDIDLTSENQMSVRLIAEGAEIFLDQDEYEVVNIAPKKYGVAIRLTREMAEDSKFPLLERNIRKAGKKFAENETNLILTMLSADAANTVTGGAAITVANITRGMQYIDDADYNPDTMFVGSEVVNDLRNVDTFTEVNKFGSNDMLKTGMVGTIFGMEVVKYSTNAAPSSTYSKYAFIIDSSEAYAIAEKRPISVENFMLPTFDMSGAAVTQRLGVDSLRANAINKITTT